MEPCPACGATPCVCTFSAEELAAVGRALTAEELAVLDRIRSARCRLCSDALWVCEDHSLEPWPHAGCDGAGSPCICNPEGAVKWQTILAEVPPDGPLH